MKRPSPSRSGKTAGARGARTRPAAKEPIARRVEIAGARPAAFKLVEKALESFDLFRSSRRIGTARVEPNGAWTAEFDGAEGRCQASARSPDGLLDLVGRFLLTAELRRQADRPVEELDPELKLGRRPTVDQRLSLEFARRAQKNRVAELDRQLQDMRRSVKRKGA
jgi:hypothetical protein